MAKQRLQKILAAAGVASRRKCEELITEGVVRVNRKVIDGLPVFADPDTDIITVRGKRIHRAEKVYFLLNKPKGVICTNSDPAGRKKAIDLIDCPLRIFCVGRLDSDLTNRLTHPRYELPKIYEVRIRGRIEGESLEKLKKGVWLAEGKTGRAAVKVIRRTTAESLIQVAIRQGLNRQVRRSIAKLGYKVKALKRIKIGNISIKGLAPGSYKKLAKTQIAYLKKTTRL